MLKLVGAFVIFILASCYTIMLPLAAAFHPSGSCSRLISVPIPSLTSTDDFKSSSDKKSISSTTLFMGKGGRKKKKKKSSSRSPPSTGKGFAAAVAAEPPIDRFPYAGSVRPGKQSPQRKVVVSSDISSDMMPDYALDGRPKKGSNMPLLPWVIEVKKPDEIEKMRASGKLAREILDLAGRAVKPGVTTDEIDTIVHEAVLAAGAYPCTLKNFFIRCDNWFMYQWQRRRCLC